MNKKILVKLVKEEAKKLKKEATKEELAKLDFETLRAQHPEQCIYGQATGRCDSPRAHELITKCAKKVYASEKLNGAPKFEPTGKRGGLLSDYVKYKYLSPIETLIQQGNLTNNEILISYLKGKTNRLNFKPF